MPIIKPSKEWRVGTAFDLIGAANTVTILSLDEMERIVLRALNGEFDNHHGKMLPRTEGVSPSDGGQR